MRHDEVPDRDGRPYPPGIHGRGRIRESEYLLQLREKQKARRIYGLLEKQFRNLYAQAAGQTGITGENLLRMLEQRLDNVVFRAGFASSRNQARQWVRHGHVTVNGKRVTIPSFQVRKGDVVQLAPKARNRDRPAPQPRHDRSTRAAQWLEVDGGERRRPCESCRCGIRSTCPCASSSSSSSTPSNPDHLRAQPCARPRGDFMLIIQRPEIEAGEAEGNTQRFIISPLEPGFGHTLGNSLRRTLLSSIPGAAVTRVRFDDALHEFDTIKGVKEDVTDIILNLKDLVLRAPRRRTCRCASTCAAPKEVTARDIQTTSDVEILNLDLPIASVNATGRLALDLTVEQGRGYASADKTKRAGAPIGEIPVDAIFSPVRRVAFEIEPTRVEQATNYDKLTLEIETDGSITPREALASAGATLRNLVGLVGRALRRAGRPGARRGLAGHGDVARPRARRSRSSTSRSARATASSGPGSTRSVSSCRRPRTTSSRSRTSARSRSRRSSRSSTSAASRCA